MKKYIVIVLCCFDCNKFVNMFLYNGDFEELDTWLTCICDNNFIVYDYENFTEVKRYQYNFSEVL